MDINQSIINRRAPGRRQPATLAEQKAWLQFIAEVKAGLSEQQAWIKYLRTNH